MAKRSVKKERNLRIRLPENVQTILGTLKENGYEAFAVGGCIRDSLMGITPSDWDITTSALPQEIKKCFRRTVDTGIEHGTVTVLIGEKSYEVTTYRIDGEYKDNRHPSEVTFTDAVSEDLRRRDFTINAMAYNDYRGLIDLFGGREDIRRRMIRCVGDANERFQEDALRILRAVRFAAQLDFDIDSMTRDAVTGHAPRLKAVSKERILTEISKLICSAHMERVAEIFQLGMIPYIAKHFREINIAQLMGLKTTAIRNSGAAKANPPATEELSESERLYDNAFDLCAKTDLEHRYLRFAFLTEGMPAENVDEMLKDLKADNQTRKNAAKLAEWILQPLSSESTELKRVMVTMSPELFLDLLRIKLVSAQTMFYTKRCAEEDIFRVIDSYNRIAAEEEPVYISDLAVTGYDLKEAGIGEGPELGKILERMLEHVWAVPADNSRETLLRMFAEDKEQ